MPPLKEYKFETFDGSIKITIKDYNYLAAWEQLLKTVRNAPDFKESA